jgi:hypothetical protein
MFRFVAPDHPELLLVPCSAASSVRLVIGSRSMAHQAKSAAREHRNEFAAAERAVADATRARSRRTARVA